MDSQGRAPRKQRSTTTTHTILERLIYVNQSLWVKYSICSFIKLYSYRPSCSFLHCLGEMPYTFLKALEKCSWFG